MPGGVGGTAVMSRLPTRLENKSSANESVRDDRFDRLQSFNAEILAHACKISYDVTVGFSDQFIFLVSKGQCH